MAAALIYEDLEVLTPYMHKSDDVVGTSLNSPELLEGNARLALAALSVLAGPLAPREEAEFVRGDSDGDGFVMINDAVHILLTLFVGLAGDACDDARDVDDDGDLGVADPVGLLAYLFKGGPPPPVPFPIPGPDPTEDRLRCSR